MMHLPQTPVITTRTLNILETHSTSLLDEHQEVPEDLGGLATLIDPEDLMLQEEYPLLILSLSNQLET